MKINQYCSVCKQHLDMEVIPTSDAGDDGVIWLRCPQCMGFLPKFSGERGKPPAKADTGVADAGDEGAAPAAERGRKSTRGADPSARRGSGGGGRSDARSDPGDVADRELPGADDDEEEDSDDGDAGEAAAGEPVAEYASLLAAADLAAARPYRPTDTYAVGDVLHHLAYGDVGVVVAKETLPGGRQAVKVYFEQAGVVRLIEQATDGH